MEWNANQQLQKGEKGKKIGWISRGRRHNVLSTTGSRALVSAPSVSPTTSEQPPTTVTGYETGHPSRHQLAALQHPHVLSTVNLPTSACTVWQ